jgi:hypothetical protein
MILLGIGILASSGCSKESVIITPPTHIDCKAPDRPELQAAKEYDRKVFFKNLNLIIEYSKELEATVECFKDGLKPGNKIKEDQK